jgi:hypothetical protein
VTVDLLELAIELARRDPGRPKSVSLRRAVSTTYYALFHALASLCADQLVGASKSWAAYTRIYRAIDHGQARKTLIALQQVTGTGAALISFATAFNALQEARLRADYDPRRFPHNRKDVFGLIDVASKAIEALDLLTSESKLDLAVQLITKPR